MLNSTEIFKKHCETKTVNTVVLYFCIRRTGSNAIANYIFNLHYKPKKIIYAYADCFDSKVDTKIKYIDPSVADHIYDYEEKMNLVLLRFENLMLNKINFKESFKVWNLFVGKYSKLLHVISLRDPFNTFASVMNHKKIGKDFIRNKPKEIRNTRRKAMIDKWKMYAKELLGETDYLPSNKIFINYNKWFVDIKYRKEVAEKFGQDFYDDKYNLLSSGGGGSSFSRMSIKDASKMPLMNRWENFKDNKTYRNIFRDEELYELSEKIFGHIKGTEIFLKG